MGEVEKRRTAKNGDVERGVKMKRDNLRRA